METSKPGTISNFIKTLDYADANEINYYVGLPFLAVKEEQFDTTQQLSQYNQWYNGSTIYHPTGNPGVEKPIELMDYSNSSSYAMWTCLLHYNMDHWGDREGIFFWEPVMESSYLWDINLNTDTNLNLKSNWIMRMTEEIGQYELQHYGRKHLISYCSAYANPSYVL